jgi:hypothetical protein
MPFSFSFTSFWRTLGLRGLSKYVVNDGVSARVDYENEEEDDGGEEEKEEEEGENVSTIQEGLYNFRVFFSFFPCGVIGDCGPRCFVHHQFWERSLVIDEIQDRVTFHTLSC